jgi:hypothetical protein
MSRSDAGAAPAAYLFAIADFAGKAADSGGDEEDESEAGEG